MTESQHGRFVTKLGNYAQVLNVNMQAEIFIREKNVSNKYCDEKRNTFYIIQRVQMSLSWEEGGG
jgi:hypothetical protein